MSYDLATIYREVPVDFTLDDCIYTGIDTQKFTELLQEFEFHSLLKKYHLEDGLTVKEDNISILPIEKLSSNTFHFMLKQEELFIVKVKF